jgi:hypothetical protein
MLDAGYSMLVNAIPQVQILLPSSSIENRISSIGIQNPVARDQEPRF